MVREGGGARSSRRIGTNGRFCRERARGSEGYRGRQGLLRESGGAWKRQRQDRAEARRVSLCDQGQERKVRHQSLLLAVGGWTRKSRREAAFPGESLQPW